MKKIILILAIAALLSLPLFAGGQQEGEEGAAKGEKKELTLWGWSFNRSDGASIHPITDAYMEMNPNVEITLLETNWNDAHDQILLMSQSNNMPDLPQVNRNWLVEFVSLDLLEDLTSRVEAVNMNEMFYEPVRGNYQGKTWIIPYMGGNSALVINRDMFNDMGLSEPKTMDEFVRLGKKVSDPAKNFYATQFCIAEKNVTGANVCNIGPVLTSMGGRYVEGQEAAFNNARGVETIQWMIDLEKKEKIAGPGSITVDARKMREVMAAEDALMTFDGAWGIPFYANYPDLNIDYILMPKGRNIGTVVNIACWGIAKSSDNKDTAWDLLQYIYEDENLELLWADGNMPYVKEYGELPEYQEKYAGFLETLAASDNYFQTGSVPQESQMYRIIVQAYHEAFLGEKDVQTALDDAANTYNDILDEFYGN